VPFALNQLSQIALPVTGVDGAGLEKATTSKARAV
jgi:hypothetical protein